MINWYTAHKSTVETRVIRSIKVYLTLPSFSLSVTSVKWNPNSSLKNSRALSASFNTSSRLLPVQREAMLYMYSVIPRTPPVNAQCWAIPINDDQNSGINPKCLSIKINFTVLKQFDPHWSVLIGIGHWSGDSCMLHYIKEIIKMMHTLNIPHHAHIIIIKWYMSDVTRMRNWVCPGGMPPDAQKAASSHLTSQ